MELNWRSHSDHLAFDIFFIFCLYKNSNENSENNLKKKFKTLFFSQQVLFFREPKFLQTGNNLTGEKKSGTLCQNFIKKRENPTLSFLHHTNNQKNVSFIFVWFCDASVTWNVEEGTVQGRGHNNSDNRTWRYVKRSDIWTWVWSEFSDVTHVRMSESLRCHPRPNDLNF